MQGNLERPRLARLCAGGDPSRTGDRLAGDAALVLKADKYVSAQYTGVIVLAEAGILKTKPAACAKELEGKKLNVDNLEWDRVTPVVVAGKIITGGDFKYASQFAETLAEKLTKKP